MTNQNKIFIALITAYIVLIYAVFSLLYVEKKKQALQTDYVEMSNIKYGLLNVDTWKEKIAIIISKKINSLSFNQKDKKFVKKKIRRFLKQSIDRFERDYEKRNETEMYVFVRKDSLSL